MANSRGERQSLKGWQPGDGMRENSRGGHSVHVRRNSEWKAREWGSNGRISSVEQAAQGRREGKIRLRAERSNWQGLERH